MKTSARNAVLTDERALTRQRLELLMHDPTNVSDEFLDPRQATCTPPGFVAAIIRGAENALVDVPFDDLALQFLES
jgi:2-hydroxy-6-oxonona-2,4-dienedioate hydrolase